MLSRGLPSYSAYAERYFRLCAIWLIALDVIVVLDLFILLGLRAWPAFSYGSKLESFRSALIVTPAVITGALVLAGAILMLIGLLMGEEYEPVSAGLRRAATPAVGILVLALWIVSAALLVSATANTFDSPYFGVQWLGVILAVLVQALAALIVVIVLRRQKRTAELADG